MVTFVCAGVLARRDALARTDEPRTDAPRGDEATAEPPASEGAREPTPKDAPPPPPEDREPATSPPGPTRTAPHRARGDERAGEPIVVWPTMTPAGDDASATPLHRPNEAEGMLFTRARELDDTLRDGAQDLGFALQIADPGPRPGRARDLDLVERAAQGPELGADDGGTWVVSARLERTGSDEYVIRLVAVAPKGKVLRVRVDQVAGSEVSVRGLVMLRNLLTRTARDVGEPTRTPADRSATAGVMAPLRSPGRAVLAANGALFGAFSAFSVQRASGSSDPRVLYPLLALGTGIGIGTALLVAEEWDVGTGDAWTLAAGAWWGALAGISLSAGRDVQPVTDRYAWGVGGGLSGLALATAALSRGHMTEGDATLVHSGAAVGFVFGNLSEQLVRGDINARGFTGSGIGTATGLVLAGALATQVPATASRVLLVDMGIGIGALAGAAAGSPLVFEDVTEGKTRAFLGATLGGAAAGGVTAYWLTRHRGATKSALSHVAPLLGPIAESQVGAVRETAWGVGAIGAF